MEKKPQKWSLYREGTLVLMVLLLISNMVLFMRLHAIQQRVNRLPTSIPSIVSYAPASQTYAGVVSLWHRLLQYKDGMVDVLVEFRLTEKQPGYEPIVRYREHKAVDPGPWNEFLPEQVDGLHYRAVLELDSALKYQYDVIQVFEGEIMRQSEPRSLDITRELGSPDVHVTITRSSWGVREVILFTFDQQYSALMEEWRLDYIIVRLDNVEQPYIVRWKFGQRSLDINSALFDRAREVTIEATYSDGETVTHAFTPSANPEPMVISRQR